MLPFCLESGGEFVALACPGGVFFCAKHACCLCELAGDGRPGEVAAEAAVCDLIVGRQLTQWFATGATAQKLLVGLQPAEATVPLHPGMVARR